MTNFLVIANRCMGTAAVLSLTVGLTVRFLGPAVSAWLVP